MTQTKPRIALPFGKDTPDNKREFYQHALESSGLFAETMPTSMDELDGLLLPGGGDVEPALYGAERHPETQTPNYALDTLESGLLRTAFERDLPVLAICRAQQLLNVVCGGTLIQHIEGHRLAEDDGHMIDIVPCTRLAAILGSGSYSVNSSHHQCVDRLAEGFIVNARSPDGIIEGIESPAKPHVIAVQWHPERRMNGPDAKLFETFANFFTSRG